MIGNKSARISIGASLTLKAKIWESNTNPGELILSWDDIGEEPSSGYSQKDLTDYDVVLSLLVEDGDATVGSVSIVSSEIIFQLDDDEVTERDRYYGTVVINNTVDTAESFVVYVLTIEVFDEIQVDVPPLSVVQIKSILAVANSVDLAVIKRHIDRAQNRMLQWMSPNSIRYAQDFGWPNRAIREGEYLAAKLLEQELYPDNENVRNDIQMCQGTIGNLTFDTDEDNIPDTVPATSVKLFRSC